MKKQELIMKLEQVQKRRFAIAMVDFWDDRLRKMDWELAKQEIALVNQLKVEGRA